jgi:hypothetical protein
MDQARFFIRRGLRRLLLRALGSAVMGSAVAFATVGDGVASAGESATAGVSLDTAAESSSCSNAHGGLTLQAKTVRSVGIAPLLVFFDATATTDSDTLRGAKNTFQDVNYIWSFGDKGISGTGTWAYGSNAGHNSKNAATGAVAAHLFVTSGSNTAYTVTVTAYDGVNTASCQLAVTAYDPAGAQGFPGNDTICVNNSSAGSGCPAGALMTSSGSFGAALRAYLASGKRVLFKCGDTFTTTGGYAIPGGITTASIGAYGGCQNTTSNRPVFENEGGGDSLSIGAVTDLRVSDIDLEGGASAQAFIAGGEPVVQLVGYNLKCHGFNGCYNVATSTQSGLINSVGVLSAAGYVSFWPDLGTTCINGSTTIYCGYGSYNQANYLNNTYNAFMGNLYNGSGTSGADETVRASVCRFCVWSNDTFENSLSPAAVLKIHNGNHNTITTWQGQYTEYLEISDNLFTGTSGAWMMENAPQNGAYDERLRYIVVERNLARMTDGQSTWAYASPVEYESIRNNVVYGPAGEATVGQCVIVARRSIEPAPTNIEVNNNTCYVPQTGNANLVGISLFNLSASFVENNLFYQSGSSNFRTIVGSAGTVSNNTDNSTLNPDMTNGSGSFSLLSDFLPRENYTGGAEVPVWYDALGVAWSPTWSLGAVKP